MKSVSFDLAARSINDVFLVIGVFHAADIPYIFGHPHIGDHDEIIDDTEMDLIAIIPWTQADLDYSDYWIDMLSNFTKTG